MHSKLLRKEESPGAPRPRIFAFMYFEKNEFCWTWPRNQHFGQKDELSEVRTSVFDVLKSDPTTSCHLACCFVERSREKKLEGATGAYRNPQETKKNFVFLHGIPLPLWNFCLSHSCCLSWMSAPGIRCSCLLQTCSAQWIRRLRQPCGRDSELHLGWGRSYPTWNRDLRSGDISKICNSCGRSRTLSSSWPSEPAEFATTKAAIAITATMILQKHRDSRTIEIS